MRPVRHIAFVLAFGLAAPGMAPAQEAQHPVVVELFTSQGCSSCPPADELLHELGMRDDVIALAYHVDYWDYLGWKDTFARHSFTERQQMYAHKTDRSHIDGRRLRGTFTPEIVVQGAESLVGSERDRILERIAAHAETPRLADIALRRDGEDLVVELTPEAARLPQMRVMLARYVPETEVEVTKGENAGQTLEYSHVVTALHMIADWDGAKPMTIRVAGVEGPCVVLLQQGKAGPIMAAAQMD